MHKPRAILILACLLSSWAVAQEDPGITMRASESFGGYDASAVIRITCDQTSMPLSEQAVNALLESTSIGEAALQEALGSTYPTKRIDVQFGYTELGQTLRPGRRNSAEQTLLGLIWLEGLDGDVMTATKAVDRIISRLKVAIQDTSTADHAALTERMALTRHELQEIESRLNTVQSNESALQNAAARSNLEHDIIREQIEQWQTEMRELQLRAEHREAQAAAMADQIARLGAQLAEEAASDQIAQELEKVVSLREREVDRVRALVANGTAPESATIKTMEALAQARSELIARQEHIRARAGQDRLQNLNNELRMSSFEASSNEVRVAQLQELLRDAEEREVLRLANEYEHTVRLQRDLLLDRMKHVHRELMELEDHLRNFMPPRLTVVRGQAAKSAPGR